MRKSLVRVIRLRHSGAGEEDPGDGNFEMRLVVNGKAVNGTWAGTGRISGR